MISRQTHVARPARVARPCQLRRAAGVSSLPPLGDLRAYQAAGASWLRDRDARGLNALLADEMGLGKTVQALRSLPRRASAIVACPASVILVWEGEILRWRPDLRVGRLGRSAPAESEILLASYDGLGEREEDLPDDLRATYLVLDEAHRAAHDGSRRTGAARLLASRCRRAWGLTGTPMTGSPRDLGELLRTLGLFEEAFPGGAKEYGELTGRRSRRRVSRKGRAFTEETWGEALPEVRERLARVMLRRERSDLLDLPAPTWVDVPCEAPADLRDHLAELTELWDSYDPRALPPFELFSSATAALARSRAAAARDLVADVSRERPALAFSAHLDPVSEIASLPGARRLTGAETEAERKEAVAAFRGGRARVLAMTLTAGGVGLNLPEAGAVVLVDEAFLPSDTDQAVMRARGSPGWPGGTLVYRMVTDHPLDVRIREILDEKRRLARGALPRHS